MIDLSMVRAAGDVRLTLRLNSAFQRATDLQVKTGAVVAEDYLQQLVLSRDGETLAEFQFSRYMRPKPTLTVTLRQARQGQQVVLTWSTSQGKRGEQTSIINV